MKRLLLKITMTLLSGLVSFPLLGQDVRGQWEGELKLPAAQLKIVLNIVKTETGYAATMDSPNQGAKGIAVTSTSFENATLTFSIASIGVEYKGVLNENSVISGVFKQNGMSMPLDFKFVEFRLRPQEPKKPYPYYEEEVRFVNSEDGVTLAGTLTLPKKSGVFPAVILISGSGAQNRDEELMEHKPFLVLSDFLTRNGIAVLRYDDRGTAASTGDFGSSTTFDFSKDAEAGVKYLLTRKEIDRKKIGLVGHSEGGCIAPMVAARSKDVAFIVMLAGVGISGDALLLLQRDLIARTSGLVNDEKDWQKGQQISKDIFEIVKKSTDTEQFKSSLTAYLEQIVKEIPDEKSKEQYGESFIRQSINSMTNPWLQYFIRYNPAPALEKVKCPVLAINGSKDLQVPAKINLEAIGKALTKGGNKKFTLREMPGLNHLFQECETGLPAEYIDIEQTFSPAALSEILQWIMKITNSTSPAK